MTYDETTILIGFINGLDKRVAFTDEAVSAWCNVLGPGIPLDKAMEYVRQHYLEFDRTVMPAHIVGRYRMNHTPVREIVISRDHDCMNGYVIITEVTEKGHAYEAVSPCPQCTKPRHQSARIGGRET
jgi:hypothetical protein